MARFKELRPSIAAFLLMMAMALTTTALSFFVGPVCEALNLGRGSFTVYYSLMTASGAVAISFLGQIINKKGVRGVLTLSAFWIAAGHFGFSFSTELWMFYAVAALMGVFGTSCISLSANVIVQQSYSSARASSLLGLVMSGSGVGGMIISLVVPGVIEGFGWRMGYRFLAVCWLVMVLAALALLGKQEMSGGIGQRKTPVDGMTRADALKSPKLYLMIAAIFALTTGCGIQQQLPSLLSGYGFDTGTVSAMVSLFTAALAGGKIVQGLLYGRVGVVRGGYVMIFVFAASYLMLREKALVYPALVALAFGMGSVTTMMPMMTRFAFGAREYAAIWSILTTASSIGSLIATPLFGVVYDAAGSYEPAMIGAAVLQIAALGCVWLCFREKRR